jgi:hypothetical protein
VVDVERTLDLQTLFYMFELYNTLR